MLPCIRHKVVLLVLRTVFAVTSVYLVSRNKALGKNTFAEFVRQLSQMC